jgi:hypothetical protein
MAARVLRGPSRRTWSSAFGKSLRCGSGKVDERRISDLIGVKLLVSKRAPSRHPGTQDSAFGRYRNHWHHTRGRSRHTSIRRRVDVIIAELLRLSYHRLPPAVRIAGHRCFPCRIAHGIGPRFRSRIRPSVCNEPVHPVSTLRPQPSTVRIGLKKPLRWPSRSVRDTRQRC